ncbi:MAG TPA: substrate-binding domain-containing protein [Opitutaceae bacterium]|nr:substrate-binding domain-containing protein [Opitutaceae bacterium]
MSTPILRYQSLATQVAARITAEIEKGTWAEWLPGERALTQTLHTSRKTLRKALAHLQREGAIKTRHGLGHEIVAPSARASTPAGTHESSVGLLTPESLENLRPYTALWVDELRSLLFENGVRLATFSGHRFFTGRPEKALARLVEQHPQTCWILAHSNEHIQHWFHEQRVACVIAGSSHTGLPLPSVDLDNFAVCRHAAGEMLRLGHRRVALFTKQSERAGDLESERGFEDGVRTSAHRDADPVVVRHDGTVDGAYRALGRLFGLAAAPTAVLIAQSAFYLTTIAFLAERGLRVPSQVSLISRDDDTFLSYLKPAPARYACNPKTYARRLLLQIQLCFDGETGGHTLHRIEPKFMPGASLSAAP